MNKKFHCYGDPQIFNYKTCFEDDCEFYCPCRIMTGFREEMYEYQLVGYMQGVIPKKEILQILILNYDISYNAAKQAIKRWKLKSKS